MIKKIGVMATLMMAVAFSGLVWAADQDQDRMMDQDQTMEQDQDRMMDQDRTMDQDQDRMMDQDRLRDQDVYGWKLMSQEERMEYRNTLRNMKTEKERARYRNEHHQQMQERARAQGLVLPDMPREGDRGMGPGGGGIGPGGGGGMGGGR